MCGMVSMIDQVQQRVRVRAENQSDLGAETSCLAYMAMSTSELSTNPPLFMHSQHNKGLGKNTSGD